MRNLRSHLLHHPVTTILFNVRQKRRDSYRVISKVYSWKCWKALSSCCLGQSPHQDTKQVKQRNLLMCFRRNLHCFLFVTFNCFPVYSFKKITEWDSKYVLQCTTKFDPVWCSVHIAIIGWKVELLLKLSFYLYESFPCVLNTVLLLEIYV